jgi:hypothetical protein
MQTQQTYSLDAKYTQTEGTILLSGVQALVRLPLDQRRADAQRGLNTAGLISGYRGSPLAGLDLLLKRNQQLFSEQQIRFIPGVNEDLGATMIFGSQIANLFPRPKYDGVIGMWYGKAPGVDRSGDIFNGMARRPASTAAATSLSTPTSRASGAMAACWRWLATMRSPNPRRCPRNLRRRSTTR